MNAYRLTNRTKSPTFVLSGCAFARLIAAERSSQMMHALRAALRRFSPHAIHPTVAARLGALEAGTRAKQRTDGRLIRSGRRPPVAQVHGRSGTSRIESAHSVLRNGPPGTRPADAGTHPRPDASGGRDDRSGRIRITAPPEPHRAHDRRAQSPIQSIVADALRAAALADTYQDALDITGDALRLLAEMSANNPGAIRRAHSAEYSYTVSGGGHA
ncbi:hypothetical protein OKW45_005555 [Paraburkholderia sp. WSM4175]